MGSHTGWTMGGPMPLQQKEVIFMGNIKHSVTMFSSPLEMKVAASALMELVGEMTQVRVVCPCGSTTRDPLMLACSCCSMEQHAACYMLQGVAQVADTHVCLECSKEGAGECTDPRMVRYLEEFGREALVRVLLYRRLYVALLDR